jgi:hypothetical protein
MVPLQTNHRFVCQVQARSEAGRMDRDRAVLRLSVEDYSIQDADHALLVRKPEATTVRRIQTTFCPNSNLRCNSFDNIYIYTFRRIKSPSLPIRQILTRARERARRVSKKWRLSQCERAAAPDLQGAINGALLPDGVVTHFVAGQHVGIENVKAPAFCP